MNIKTFLIENYIWILVIVLITIVTIIGFLSDKKRGGKKIKNTETTPQNINNQGMINQPVNNQAPIQYNQPKDLQVNQMNNNVGMNFNNMNTTVRPLNQINNQQPTITEPQPIQPMSNSINFMNNPQPVENVAPNTVQEPMYQPLSEQKPVIAPQPIPNFNNMQSSTNNEFNQVQPMPINQIQPEINTLNVIPPVATPITQQPSPMMMEQTLNPAPINSIQPQIQPIENNNFGSVPNFIPNNTTIPQPVNPIPEPKPVMPQTLMQDNYNQSGIVQTNLNQQQPVIGQPNTNMTQPEQIVTPQPINFVYGPQNNNSNM